MVFHLDHNASAQEWINAGLAIPTPKGKESNFANMSFVQAQANQLLFLTGKGALSLDRYAKNQPPPSPN